MNSPQSDIPNTKSAASTTQQSHHELGSIKLTKIWRGGYLISAQTEERRWDTSATEKELKETLEQAAFFLEFTYRRKHNIE